MKKQYVTKINPRIKEFADKFGIEFRVAKDPFSAKIHAPDFPTNDKKIIAVYFGEGVVWVRDKTSKPKFYIDIVCLHELGHGILQFYNLNHSPEIEEVMANAISLAFAAYLQLPVSEDILKNYNKYSQEVKESKWKQRCKSLLSSSMNWVRSALPTPRKRS